eukprot:2948581-Rhodomonas_salina.2
MPAWNMVSTAPPMLSKCEKVKPGFSKDSHISVSGQRKLSVVLPSGLVHDDLARLLEGVAACYGDVRAALDLQLCQTRVQVPEVTRSVPARGEV